MLNKTSLLGVEITAETEKNILEEVFQLVKKGKKFIIVTPNPEILMYAKKHKPYQTILNQALVSLPDGVGLLLAANILGIPLKTRITGVDFIENLCKESKDNPMSMGFLGGRTGVAERTAECLARKYPWVRIAFAGEEWPQGYLDQKPGRGTNQNLTSRQTRLRQNQAENSNQNLRSTQVSGFEKKGRRGDVGVVLSQSRLTRRTPSQSSAQDGAKMGSPIGLGNEKIDILFVALGFPRQEQWIAENLEHLPVTAAMGVGGSFDYLSGEVVRAPSFLRTIGLEWLFRLLAQPWRWKRQLALLEFIVLVLKAKFNKHK